MSSGSEGDRAAKERLSALVDGELDSDGVTQACVGWRDDAALRAAWHAYHWIGDALRSDELCSDTASDAAFVQALRERLVGEPGLPAAPARSASAAVASGGMGGRLRSWMAPSAVAAGFAAVAGVVFLMRAPQPLPPVAPGASLAQAAAPATAVQRVAAAEPATAASDASAEPQALVANGKLIRDAQLDRYLAAHKQFAGSSALGVPSAFLRGATSDASNR
jgi:sigma-E factor negative regulatory protein RseA